jgi:hypothetical protein
MSKIEDLERRIEKLEKELGINRNIIDGGVEICPICGSSVIIERMGETFRLKRCSNPECWWTWDSGGVTFTSGEWYPYQ